MTIRELREKHRDRFPAEWCPYGIQIQRSGKDVRVLGAKYENSRGLMAGEVESLQLFIVKARLFGFNVEVKMEGLL